MVARITVSFLPTSSAQEGGGLQSYPDACLRQVGPDGDLLPGAHVRVAVSLESGFQLLELLAGEVRPLPPLLLLERAVLGVGVVRLVLLGLLGVCVRNREMGEIPRVNAGGLDTSGEPLLGATSARSARSPSAVVTGSSSRTHSSGAASLHRPREQASALHRNQRPLDAARLALL